MDILGWLKDRQIESNCFHWALVTDTNKYIVLFVTMYMKFPLYIRTGGQPTEIVTDQNTKCLSHAMSYSDELN